MDLNLGFLASNHGRNIWGILDAIEANELHAAARVVICDTDDAPVLDMASQRRVPIAHISPRSSRDLDISLLEALRYYGVNLVVLDDYASRVDEVVLDGFHNKVLGSYPTLPSKHCRGRQYAGDAAAATIYCVAPDGSHHVLNQHPVTILSTDTLDSLAKKVLEVEICLFRQTLRDIQQGRIDLDRIA